MDDHDGEYKDCVTWSFYHNYWKTEYPNLKVNRPSEDICGLCFQFYNKHKFVMKNTLLSPSKGTGEGKEEEGRLWAQKRTEEVLARMQKKNSI